MNVRILGVAGGTASGKTTLATQLTGALHAVCISHDSYYKTLPDAFRGRVADYNFDHPDSLDNERLLQDLESLTNGKAIQVPSYDYATCSRLEPSTWRSVQPKPWIIVEGILVLAIPALRARFDCSVFVDCPGDIRLVRRMRRDCIERGDQPEPLLVQYLKTVRPMHQQWVQPSAEHACLRLDGRSPVEGSVQAVLSLLENIDRSNPSLGHTKG